MRLGFAVKVLGAGGLPTQDTRRWQSDPHLKVSVEYLHAVFAYLAVAGGWPATWIMLAALATGFTIESLVRRDRSSPAVGWAAPLGLRALSTVAGMVPAVLTVLPLVHAMDHTVRNGTVSNRNFLVPNLADMLAFAAPSLHGDLMTFGNQTTVTIPIYFAAWFAVPVLWLVPWRASLVRAPGLVTAAIGMVAMAMATQAPSALGPLRDPVRALAGAQFFLVVGVVVLACTAPLVYSRLRGGGMAVSLLLMAMLTWFRDPPGVSGVLAVVAVAAAVAVVVGLLARSRLTVAGGVTLVATLLLAVLAFGLNEVDPDNANVPVRLYPGALTFGRSDQPALAIYSKAAPDEHDEWYADGVGRGFERMTAGTRFAPGYSSIRQSYYSQQFCVLVAQGETCPEVVRSLFATEDRTDRPWIELLGYRTVVVTGRQERRDFATLSHGSWRRVDQGAAFTEYRRRGPAAVTGRVTDVLGEADLQVVSQSPESQSYDVSSADGATLVFRDLYWPGYHATLDGSPLAVDSLDDILVSVTLPPGAHGRLTLSYSPLSTAELVGLPAAGGALMGAAMLGVVWWRRRSEPGRSAGVDGDGGEREPDEREPLQHPV